MLRYVLDDFANRQGLELLLTMLYVEAAVHSAGSGVDAGDAGDEGAGDAGAGDAVQGSVQGSVGESGAGNANGAACSRRYQALLMDALQGLRCVYV